MLATFRRRARVAASITVTMHERCRTRARRRAPDVGARAAEATRRFVQVLRLFVPAGSGCRPSGARSSCSPSRPSSAWHCLPRLGAYLAPTERAVGNDGRGARTLIVEGWLDDDALGEAIAHARSGRYERVVTSGGPIETWREIQPWPTYAERAADYLRRHGVRETPVVAVPAPALAQDRSFLSAVVVRDWARARGFRSTPSTCSRPASTRAARDSSTAWRSAPASMSASSPRRRSAIASTAGGRRAKARRQSSASCSASPGRSAASGRRRPARPRSAATVQKTPA